MKFQIMAGASAAALLFAGSAFAQGAQTAPYTPAVSQTTSSDSSSIDQIGNGNAATVNQSGGTPSDGVGSVIIQGGPGFAGSANNNTATVGQTGAGDRSLVIQATSLSTNGTNGNAPGGTTGNTSNITQGGHDQSAFSYQFGSNNLTTVNQLGTGDKQLGGNANEQGVTGVAGVQTGINAAVAQRHVTFPAMETAVTGGIDPNQNTQAVNVVQDWAVNNLASAQQEATSHNSRVDITQAYQAGSTAKADQGSFNQDAWISQEDIFTNPANNNNTASITQTATNELGSAAIAQFDAINSYSAVTENGGVYSKAYSYQTGANEYSTIYQTDGSTAAVTQTGGNDVSLVTQGGGVATANTATVNQGLANAWSTVNQTGVGNTSTVTQGTPVAFLAPR